MSMLGSIDMNEWLLRRSNAQKDATLFAGAPNSPITEAGNTGGAGHSPPTPHPRNHSVASGDSCVLPTGPVLVKRSSLLDLGRRSGAEGRRGVHHLPQRPHLGPVQRDGLKEEGVRGGREAKGGGRENEHAVVC